MDGLGVIIKAYKVLSIVGGTFSAYRVDVKFTEEPSYASRYTICAKSDKVAADKGLRCFISDVAANRSKK
jgi:hypothetical protein